MKTNIQVKDEPVEFQNYANQTVNELLRFYGYHLPGQPSKSTSHQDQEPSTCAWCQKVGVRSFTFRTDTGECKSLCSEICFNQYRRASFKKNKTSDSNVPLPLKIDRPTIHKTKSIVEKKANSFNDRRKLVVPVRRPISMKTNEEIVGKRPRLEPPVVHLTSAGSTSNFSWPSSFLFSSSFPWLTNPEVNSYLPPSIPPAPPSTLNASLSKGISSTTTCLLPTFIPLPIPIPIPLVLPFANRHSIELNDQQSQTEDPSTPRRKSI